MVDEEGLAGTWAPGEAEKWREPAVHEEPVMQLFPLPVPRGRRHRREAAALQALNWLSGFRRATHAEPQNADQSFVCARVRRLLSQSAAVRAAQSDRSCFLQLLKARSEYDLAGPGTNVVPLQSVSAVSMPDDVHDAPSVLDLVPEAAPFLCGRA